MKKRQLIGVKMQEKFRDKLLLLKHVAISVKMKIRMNQILIFSKLNLDRNKNMSICITWYIHNLILSISSL